MTSRKNCFVFLLICFKYVSSVRRSQQGGKRMLQEKEGRAKVQVSERVGERHPVQNRGETRRVGKPKSEGEGLCQTHGEERPSARGRLSGSLSLCAYPRSVVVAGSLGGNAVKIGQALCLSQSLCSHHLALSPPSACPLLKHWELELVASPHCLSKLIFIPRLWVSLSTLYE